MPRHNWRRHATQCRQPVTSGQRPSAQTARPPTGSSQVSQRKRLPQRLRRAIVPLAPLTPPVGQSAGRALRALSAPPPHQVARIAQHPHQRVCLRSLLVRAKGERRLLAERIARRQPRAYTAPRLPQLRAPRAPQPPARAATARWAIGRTQVERESGDHFSAQLLTLHVSASALAYARFSRAALSFAG